MEPTIWKLYGSPDYRHSVDAILSFANRTTVVSKLMHELNKFVIQWAQTPSDYDILIANTMSVEWAQKHLPVLSQKNQHTLYIGYHVAEPKGEPVLCHRQDCGVENQVWVSRT